MIDVVSRIMSILSGSMSEYQTGIVEGVLRSVLVPELDALQQMCGDLEQRLDKETAAHADARQVIDRMKASAKQSSLIAQKSKRSRYRYSESEAVEIRSEIVRNIEHMIAVGIPNTITKYNETFHPYPTVKVRCDRIGVTWNELVVAAGGTPNFSGKQYAAMKAAKTFV